MIDYDRNVSRVACDWDRRDYVEVALRSKILFLETRTKMDEDPIVLTPKTARELAKDLCELVDRMEDGSQQ